MKLDLKRFKKISSDDNETILEHEKGHRIHIAHKSLEPKMRSELNKIQQFYSGGMPDPTISQEPVPTASAMPSEEQQIMQQAGQPVQQPQAQATPAPQSISSQDEMMESPKQAAPVTPPVESPKAAENPEEDPMGYNKYEKGLQNSYETEKSGFKQEQLAKSAQALEEKTALENHATAVNTLRTNWENAARISMDERKKFINDYESGHIQPKQIFSNMSMPQTILAAIGLLVGGMSSGMTGQANPVMAMLNKRIDDDVDAQKAEMGKQHNLVSANMQEFKNINDAAEMARIHQSDYLASQLRIAAAKANNPLAEAELLKQSGAIDIESGKRVQQLDQKKVLNDFLNNPPSPEKIPYFINAISMGDPKTAEELRKAYVPGVGISKSGPVPNDVKAKIIAGNDLRNKIRELKEFANEHGGKISSMGPAIRAQGESMAKDVLSTYRIVTNQGVFKASSTEFDEGLIPQHPTALFGRITGGTNAKYEQLERSMKQSHDALLKGYGLKKIYSEPLKKTPL